MTNAQSSDEADAGARPALGGESERLAAVVTATREFLEDVTDYDALLQTITQRVAEGTGDACTIRLLSDDGEWLNAVGAYHRDPELRAAIQVVVGDSAQLKDIGVWGRVIDERRTLRIPVRPDALPADSSPQQIEFARQWPIRDILLVPLVARGRAIGGIALVRYRDPMPFTDAEQSFLQDLASRAALAIDNARLYRDAQRLNAELERRVEERTAALAKATASAEEANRAKPAFLANMSHELRTPLNAVLGFSDLLEEQMGSTLGERQRTYLRHIRDAGQHLLRLINDVLDLSKVEAGRMDLRQEWIGLDALLTPIIAAERIAAEKSGVLFDAACGQATVFVDPGRVRQILLNILSNAVKFTPRGGRVQFRAWSDDATLRFEIVDSGIGIAADKRDQVFMAFQRLHENVYKAEGTGLGLALTKRLVELHRGTISLESEVGRGTTFRVDLPGVVHRPVTGRHLLVIDDDPGDGGLVWAISATLGLACELVPDRAAALASLARERPVGIVLDLRLAGDRGESVLSALRDIDPTVPVIIVSTEDEPSRERISALGIDEHLTKPIDRQRLERWIRELPQMAR